VSYNCLDRHVAGPRKNKAALINPEVWLWYHRLVGDGRCPIVDTWWQTETGGILITPLPGAIDQKPGSATLPFFGVEPTIVDDQGNVLKGACTGNLCISRPWPGIMRGVYGDADRFFKTYFSTFPGRYFTGDGCRRDEGSASLRDELIQHVRRAIGALATPDVIHWAPSLPKTRSGKIMRRILRKVAAGEFDQLGDTSTLADPSVVDQLVQEKKARTGR